MSDHTDFSLMFALNSVFLTLAGSVLAKGALENSTLYVLSGISACTVAGFLMGSFLYTAFFVAGLPSEESGNDN